MASGVARRVNLQKIKGVWPKIPDKLKGGRLEKIGSYLMNIASDYQAVALETVQDMKDRPLKSSIYLSGLGTLGILLKTNPDETSYRTELQGCANDLSLLGDLVRNPKSDTHIQMLMHAQKDGQLKYQSFGFFSVMWMSRFASHIHLFEAKCKQVNTPWYRLHENVVDVGVFGRWRTIEKEMIDYDINPTEWEGISSLKT